MDRMLLSLFCGLMLISCDKLLKKDVKLDTDQAKFSYVVGQQIAQNFKSQAITVDPQILASSIADAMEGKPSRLSSEEMGNVMANMRKEMMAKREKDGSDNKKKAEEFLKENGAKKGITTTKSGLQYEVLTEGKGKTPKADSTVKVHYKGTLLDGSEFDSSYKRNEPAEFPVKGVIAGWTEALQLMKVGDKWKLYVPPELAYGEMPRPGIPANSLLTFEVELLEIKK